jgi:aryl-phospho-beta-D-glucosidase BglC (GH1 family)
VRKINTKKLLYSLLLITLIPITLMNIALVTPQSSSEITIRSSGSIVFIRPLHVDGRYIKNDIGQVVTLKGVNKHGFEDFPEGSWQRPDGGVSYGVFDSTVVGANLDAMNSWGINFVRSYSTAEFWIDNTEGHRQIVKDLATLASQRGIYLMYSFWHILSGASQTALPYPPYCEDNPYLNSEADFVAMWRSIAEELKDYPNIIFELWNEPHKPSGMDVVVARDSWFSVAQQCIDAIRETGATNIIVVQWDYGIWMNLDYNNGGTMDWVEQYPLDDPSGNIAYSAHLYRGDIHRTEPERENSWEYDDLLLGLQLTKVDYVLNTLHKPVIIGEIGPNMWDEGVELERSLAFYNNSLTIFNEWGLNYAIFWWWRTGRYPHLTAEENYQPNVAGDILRAALSYQG